MSRLGKQSIAIPSGVEVKKDHGTITVKGPLGELSRVFSDTIEITVANGEITTKPVADTQETKALWGTYAAHLRNMIRGVTEGFQKKLIIEGVGYKAEISGANMVLSLGFSHKVNKVIPPGVKAVVEKGVVTLSGMDKEVVGQFAADIRAHKKPEPYKGKGIRYEKEVVRRKQGKRSV